MEFARLGEVRSLIPPHVNVLALTATTTKETRKAVIKRLSMRSPKIILITPNNPNLLYLVRDKPELFEAMLPLIEKLQANQLPSNHKIIIFCRKYDELQQDLQAIQI